MVHVQTGNRLDVVYDHEGSRKVLKGLKPWDGELILLTDPQAVVDVLQTIINECEVSEHAKVQEQAKDDNRDSDSGGQPE